METGNLPEKEFRIMTVKKIQDLGKRMAAKIEKIQEMFTKDLDELKNKKKEMNNTLKGSIAEEWVNDWEARTVGITASEQNIDKE